MPANDTRAVAKKKEKKRKGKKWRVMTLISTGENWKPQERCNAPPCMIRTQAGLIRLRREQFWNTLKEEKKRKLSWHSNKQTDCALCLPLKLKRFASDDEWKTYKEAFVSCLMSSTSTTIRFLSINYLLSEIGLFFVGDRAIPFVGDRAGIVDESPANCACGDGYHGSKTKVTKTLLE